MSLASFAILFAVLTLPPGSDLRLYNPQALPVDATLTCGGTGQALRLEPGGVFDRADGTQCTGLRCTLPLAAYETSGQDVQRLLGSEAECGETAMVAPLFGCQAGSGTVAVPVTGGATYAWSVEGAAIVEGAGTPRVLLAFGQSGTVRVTCIIATAECSRTAGAVIALREPISIAQLAVPQSAATDTPVTVTWTYGAAAPVSQLLTGDALDAPVALPAAARSYTFTPKRAGSRTLELRASYFAAMTADAPRGKRRAAGRSAATATDCATASAVRRVEVKGCDTVEPAIAMPAVVDAGVPFEARVDLHDDELSEWSVENGTIVAAYARDGRATIRPGESGEVRVSVVVRRGTCTRAASAASRVLPAAQQCSVSPIAALSLVSHDCSRAVVRAAFTGTPPFRGTWSDGTPFETNEPSLQHAFILAGTYGITGFRDASCIGVTSGAPAVETFRARARLDAVGGACTNGRLVAHLTGTPPFAFRWAGGSSTFEWATTSETEIVRELKAGDEGTWLIDALSDAVCSEQSQSNSVTIDRTPWAEVLPGPACALNEPGTPALWVQFREGRAPYSVTWSDGTVTTSNQPGFVRTVPKPVLPLEEYTVVSGASNGCVAELGNRTVSASYRPQPIIGRATIPYEVCTGDPQTAALTRLPGATANVVWTIPGGEVLTGQGTAAITWRATSVTDSRIRAEAVYPDGACSSYDEVAVRFQTTKEMDFKVVPAVIHRGQSAVISFRNDFSLVSRTLDLDPGSRRADLGSLLCGTDRCTATFGDTNGPGTVTFALKYSGQCTHGEQTLFTTLTIQE